MKPLFAVAGVLRPHNPESAFIFKEAFVNEAYTSSLEKAGAIPYILPYCSIENIENALAPFDALLVPGGADINPSYYNHTLKPYTVPPSDPYMDEYQLALIKAAHKMGKWVFGICRGFQAINIVNGGVLYQDINTERPISIEHMRKDSPYESVHSVKLLKDSHLYKAFGKEEITVNSLHHQGVCTPSDKLTVTAISEDGIVEGLEGDHFLAVQWHPEALKSPFFDYIVSLVK